MQRRLPRIRATFTMRNETELPTTPPPRYDLLAANLIIALIAALLLSAVGSRVELVSLLEQTEIAGREVSLAVGAAVNPGVATAAAAIFFALCGALCCAGYNHTRGRRRLVSAVAGWLSWFCTAVAMAFFMATLILTPLTLAVQVGL